MHPVTDVRGVLYRGGTVLTVDPARPQAEAAATRAGRIVAVGSEDDCRRALGITPADSTATPRSTDGAATVDLGGGALLPGFVDAHLHPIPMCFFVYHLDLKDATTVDETLEALAERARDTPPGEWVVGLNLTADQLAERRWPDIAELDTVGAGRAVVILGRDGHTSVGNTVALAAAGIRGSRADPSGGSFERDDRGRLTGVCYENASRVLLSGLPVPDLDQLKSSVHEVFGYLASRGITSAGLILQTDSEGPAGPAGALESVAMMIFADQQPLCTHSILCGQPNRAVDARASSSLHNPAQGREVGGVKLYLDGTLGARTACLHRAYADAPAQQGWLTLDPEVAMARMEAIHLAELQICVHAIGDAANSLALDLFAKLLQRHPAEGQAAPRHRIEHASVLDEGAVERFAELGITAAVQPLFLRSEAPWLKDRLGPERAGRTYPFRTMRDAGVVLAGSSDAPLEDPDVLAGIAAAVTRTGFEPDQALTAAQAVEAYTWGGAYAQRREHVAGRIAEGYRADLVILSGDPTAVPPERLPEITVEATVVGGQAVYRRPG